jgi:hypothetical protein
MTYKELDRVLLIAVILAATIFILYVGVKHATPSDLCYLVDPGQPVYLKWDANVEPDLVGYRVYQAQAALGYTDVYVKEIEAPTTTVKIETVVEGDNYFVVTAVDQAGNESGYSNEVKVVMDVGVPSPPKNNGCSGVPFL